MIPPPDAAQGEASSTATVQQLRSREQALVKIRWVGVLFGLLQMGFYDPDTALGRMVGYGLLVVVALANIAIWWAANHVTAPRHLQRLGVAAFALHVVVLLAFTYLYSFQQYGSTWLILYLAPLEAALRYGLRGTLLTAGLISLLYLPREPYRELVYGYPSELRSAVFRLGVLWIVALFVGFMARGLERERDEARRLAVRQTELLEQLRSLDRLKDDFIASTSHELRTPLAVMTGFTELLQTRFRSSLPDEANRYITEIARAGRRLTLRVEMLLDFAVLEGSALTLDRRAIPFGPFARDVLDLYEEAAARAGVTLVNDVDDDVRVEADPRRLRAALGYLVDNGIRFNRPGGQVTVTARPTADSVVVEVTDTGTGMAPEIMATIFEPFQRGEIGDTAVRGGQGLGLTLARRIAIAHGGSLQVESEPGKGSTFRLVLPVGTGAAEMGVPSRVLSRVPPRGRTSS